MNVLSGGAIGLLDDREANASLVTVLFRDGAPGVLGFLAGLERTLHLGRAFHELVEVHRAELAANHPEITACAHDKSPVLTVSRTDSWCCERRPPSGQPRRRSSPCDRRRYRIQPCSGAWRRRCPGGSRRAARSSHSPTCPARRNSPWRDCRSTAPPCDRSAA